MPTPICSATPPAPIGGPTPDPGVLRVQADLNTLARGSVLAETGELDAATARALRRFQEQEGLAPTGTLDDATLERLRVRAETARREQDVEAEEARSQPAGDPAGCTGPRTRADYASRNDAYADTHADDCGAFAGAAAHTGDTAELYSASVQLGSQSEAQVGMARIRMGDDTSSVEMDVFTAEAGIGTHNSDGSRGFNIGAEATAISAEVTTRAIPGVELTAGGGIGAGASGSIGVRDRDGDGEGEVCVRVSAGFATVGACVELGFAIPPALTPGR